MGVPIEEVARILELEENQTIEAGLRALLSNKLREVRSEALSICMKYGVSSLRELDEKINRGELSETDTIDDFIRVDYLESIQQRIEGLKSQL